MKQLPTYLCSVILFLCLLTSCDLLFPGKEKETEIPEIELTRVWAIDGAHPDGVPISIWGNYLMIPQHYKGGLVLANAETGEVLWREEELFRPISAAALHSTGIYILGYFPDNDDTFLYRFSVTEGYLGYFPLRAADPTEGIAERNLNLIDDSLYWTGRHGNVHRFDLTGEIEELGSEVFDPVGHHEILYTIPQAAEKGYRLGDSPIPVGETDILFTYEDEPGREECWVIRMNRYTGQIVWKYRTIAENTLREDLLLIGDKLLVNGNQGWELIDCVNPAGKEAYWAYYEPSDSKGYPLVVGNVIYTNSVYSEKSIRAYSLKTGGLLWTLATKGSVRQGMQHEKGVLYVSSQSAVLMIDAAKGKYIGRDSTHPGYSQQVNDTVQYGDLFIHFTDSVRGGRVEALRMDKTPL